MNEELIIFDDSEDELTDEELDKLYVRKPMNSRATMVPVHVYRILVEKTNPKNHITQAEIRKILLNKYEISIERRTLARCLNTLADEGLGIRSSKTEGVWFDAELCWYNKAC